MSIVVQKYGGTSVDGPERIRAVARRVAAARQAGHDLIVVVSAMGHSTDELIRLAHQVSEHPNRRELDMLVTTGERVSMALLAMALHDLEVPAISFTGSQSGILTHGPHASARVREVRPDRIRAALEQGRVAIVAGFQGVDPETREITTLGRGGSDTTAVALAAAFGAACEICTDVDGVMTADPRLVPDARVVPQLGYRSCSTLAHLGGRVLHARCVDLAARSKVRLVVRSSFTDHPGTRIEEDRDMESPRIEAIAHREPCSLVIAEGNAGGRGEARGILESVAETFPELELVAHEQVDATHGVIAWMGERADAESLVARFRELRGPGGEWRARAEHDASFVSLVGLGLGATQAADAERALERAGVAMLALRVSASALVIRVAPGRAADAVRALHAALIEL
ncbi:MAG: aspartate kinase [Candidatus Eisenbacteria bacterium]|uniref:Aspartokinase n=1 Tax=Eiseniibacteriota bacterium TaxID=2212470 RepID=A0A849SH55_UNCEI|nr:aspartate kinase [Candidatus Eisenbacteria bacterium]